MRLKAPLFVFFMLFLLLALYGCKSGSENQVNIEILKEKAAAAKVYSFDYYRKLGSEEIHGKLYYENENIRFELNGQTPEDTTVTIVNQEENKTYAYNTKLGIGEIQEPAFFSQDVPLPGEVMSGLNTGNTKFMNQGEWNNQKCTVFQVTDAQFYGYKFSGEIWINNQTGMPVLMDGSRGSAQVKFEYKNFSAEGISEELFEPPANIDFKKWNQ